MANTLSPLDGPGPDLMNDPRYATNLTDGDDGYGEADTCRICRTEGGDSESLFHPCKCSGSIKYVHQDCLMEWLSHSQKKHCELCKTPFRFTKLYSPNMPQTLPFHLLVRHVFLHILKNLGTWLRFGLVALVWLGCLPFAIRQVWRLLFWFSDGGWPAISGPSSVDSTGAAKNLTNEVMLQLLTEQAKVNATSPVTPFLAAQTTPAHVVGIVDRLAGIVSPVALLLNVSDTDPLVGGFFRAFLSAFGAQHVLFPPEGRNVSPQNYDLSSMPNTSTLLSEVHILKTFTRFPLVNQLLIAVVEGYVITVLVVICFILIFLIREWVVQQQPGINMGAGFNADFAPIERGRDQQAVPVNNAAEPQDIGQRQAGRLRRRHAPVHGENLPIPVQGETDLHGESTQHNRPSPVRDALSPAAEIQRRLTEEPRFTEDFLSIWRRAEGDPSEVLRIIEAENKSEQMRYWVNSMKVLQRPYREGILQQSLPSWADEGSSEVPTSRPETQSSHTSFGIDGVEDHDADNESNSALSEDQIERFQRPQQHFFQEPNLSRKGKERAAEENHNPSLPAIFSSSSGTRPRAISDGPQPIPTLSPLASGTWTFNNLPDTVESGESVRDGDREQQLTPDPKTTSSTATRIPASISPRDTPAYSFHQDEWKVEQDLRVQRAIEKGRLLREYASQMTAASSPPSYDVPTESEGEPIEIIGRDGVVRTVDSWEDELANHPVSGSDFDHDEAHILHDQPQGNPFDTETPLPEPRPAVVIAVPQPRGFVDSITDFFWGGVGEDIPNTEPLGNDEHIVHDLAAEPPFVPVANREFFDEDQDDEDDPEDLEVAEAAIAAGIDPNDPDAMDDAEDFEGIMELVGMRGPVFSLFQNAIFSAFLLSLTVAVGIWIPYNIGRIALLLLANPMTTLKLPLKFMFGCAAFIQDMALSAIGISTYFVALVASIPFRMLGIANSPVIAVKAASIGSAALNLAGDSLERISNGTVESIIHFSDSEIFAFSAASHEALINILGFATETISAMGSTFSSCINGNPTLATSFDISRALAQNATMAIKMVPSILVKPETWVISLEIPKRTVPLDLALSVWSGTDRFWAVMSGYTTLCIAGALYVKKGTPFSSSHVGREWEHTIIDLLNQAGGVFKVILIISIEMLVFPLYCGLLLDVALLPLFENATIVSRLRFTHKSPFTSIFVHWFVGTCYMFHFALFVSMCRKIMRKGVLYFIRDPDDPTFHPVRDVLERNVATQLRKILFSALVYGALVIICLGGVVWGLAFAFRGVLPIHWSSNEPVLEFPVDLLFYNFLMPLAVRFFKPSDALHSMYTWWFRKCARMLRLTWFMFDERMKDEEGYHVRRAWGDALRLKQGDPEEYKTDDDPAAPFTNDPNLTAYFRRDGRYVRAPASDQVRIPKGQRIFLEVNEQNKRVDGEPDPREGIHGSENPLYKHLYVPPWFRLRISIFIVSIWFFAAFTGVSTTIIPLVFGRFVFAKVIPPHVRKNDIYAFSIGVYILGSSLYAVLHLKTYYNYLKQSIISTIQSPNHFLRRSVKLLALVTNVTWTYAAFLLILPALFAAFVELYFIVPLHTYFALEERHVVHFVQSWTLGLLYVKLTTRFILWHENSRQAQALRAITRNGYLNPNARLATRSFILPLGFVLSFAIIIPWAFARLVTNTVFKDRPETHILAYRYTYPLCLCFATVCFMAYLLGGMLRRWQMVIRDEVYLIGERLHNFGERKSTTVGVGSPPSMRRIET